MILTWFPLLVPAQEQDVSQWPQFRGPTGLGLAASTHLPLTWGGPKGENVLWQSPLKGQGHASPIVWDNTVVVCTGQLAFQRDVP